MAAAEELGRHGYANTSLDGIAERLDVTKASLYYYFDSKETLLRACVEAVAEQSIARIEEAAAAGGSAGERLRRMVSVQVRDLLTYPDAARLFVYEANWPPSLETEIRTWRERHTRPLRVAIDEGVRSGEFDVVDPALAHLCLMGSMNSVLTWPRRRRPTDAYVELITDQLLRLVIAPPSSRRSTRLRA